MSKAKDGEAEDKPAKKSGPMKWVLLTLAIAGAGAGSTYGAFAAGLIGNATEQADNGPKLVMKGEEDPFAPAAGKGDHSAVDQVFGSGGSKYRTAYYRFESSFTSNLKNSAGLVQLDLAASTERDGRVLQWLQRHELAVRSAILAELADTPEDEVYAIEGKERLRKRLVAAVNRVLIDKEGFGGVDEIHFESFLVQ